LLAIKLQTFEDFECIVAADYGDMYADKVCGEFDSRFTCHHIDVDVLNVGALGKNKGIEQSTTPYICYCDDDNILLPNHLVVLYQKITEESLDIVYSRFNHVFWYGDDSYTILNNDLYYIGEDGKHQNEVRDEDALVMMHTKTRVQKVGGWRPRAEIGYNEDSDFMRRMACKTTGRVNAVTAIYNWRNAYRDVERNTYLAEVAKHGDYAYPELVAGLKGKYL
jgi:glycosyltransferase involved in cell wall biosynthesis